MGREARKQEAVLGAGEGEATEHGHQSSPLRTELPGVHCATLLDPIPRRLHPGMRKDHEEQLQRLRLLKDREIDAVTSATSHTNTVSCCIRLCCPGGAGPGDPGLHDPSPAPAPQVPERHHRAGMEVLQQPCRAVLSCGGLRTSAPRSGSWGSKQQDKQLQVLGPELLCPVPTVTGRQVRAVKAPLWAAPAAAGEAEPAAAGHGGRGGVGSKRSSGERARLGERAGC